MAGENFSGCFFYRDLKYGKRWFILLEGNFKSPQKSQGSFALIFGA